MKSYNVCLKDTVKTFTKRLFYCLFDCEQEEAHNDYLENTFLEILSKLEIENGKSIWETFKSELPEIRRKLDLDAIAFESNDPASHSLAEIYMAYPGFYAISIYRLSHALYKLKVHILPRMMSEFIHGITGIDIHPGATIGNSFYIDHGTGIVIGETSIIGENVKIYQGVTLGGISVAKSLASTKRHPTIENNVCIYANATILGGDIVIGANSIIGANVWITQSVPENSLVTYQTEIKIRPKNNGIQ
ncbi:serine acetyltransferase [Pseudalgibacter alginicilyticus]|uniref:Serine acetyltransferase n=1 Tax=Pseudalgibacter alginicilyticus TaxID=1736674 RepID=A0A0P0CFM0_9FLAO|nr:serine O-acetyltransferase EpsC [Pseudalgibacter alginicilyticus]ALJ04955.1 serine acetyltransferase [Pseudalgibacter alginicilyticus]